MTGRKLLLPLSLLLSAMSAVAGMAPFVLVWFVIRELMSTETTSWSMVQVYAWSAALLSAASIALNFLALKR